MENFEENQAKNNENENEYVSGADAEIKNSSADSQKNDDIVRKIIFALCYLWGILFFLPLILYKNDNEAKVHANQGLVLLLFSVIGNLIFSILTFIPVLNVIFSVIAWIYSAALLILGIIGIVYVVTDNKNPLPLIGGIKIIK